MQILFCDFNGTIADDEHICAAARKATFWAFDKRPPAMRAFFRALVERGGYIGAYEQCGLTAPRDHLNAIWTAVYAARMRDVRLFPGVAETLAALRARGVQIAIVTMNFERLTTPILGMHRIDHLFRYRCFHVTDKASAVANILQAERADPKQCYFVGDAPSDVCYAKAAGVNAVAFLAGHLPKKMLLDAKPDYCISSFGELLELP